MLAHLLSIKNVEWLFDPYADNIGISKPNIIKINLLWLLYSRICIVEFYYILHVKTPSLPKRPYFLRKRPHFLPRRPRFFYQNAPTIFQNKSYFTKTPPLLYCQNDTFNNFFLLKRRYMYHVWCLVIQDLFSKFICCICIHAYLTSDNNKLVYTFICSGNSIYKYIKLTYILGKV
jgi:hypothetical protein